MKKLLLSALLLAAQTLMPGLTPEQEQTLRNLKSSMKATAVKINMLEAQAAAKPSLRDILADDISARRAQHADLKRQFLDCLEEWIIFPGIGGEEENQPWMEYYSKNRPHGYGQCRLIKQWGKLLKLPKQVLRGIDSEVKEADIVSNQKRTIKREPDLRIALMIAQAPKESEHRRQMNALRQSGLADPHQLILDVAKEAQRFMKAKGRPDFDPLNIQLPCQEQKRLYTVFELALLHLLFNNKKDLQHALDDQKLKYDELLGRCSLQPEDDAAEAEESGEDEGGADDS